MGFRKPDLVAFFLLGFVGQRDSVLLGFAWCLVTVPCVEKLALT